MGLEETIKYALSEKKTDPSTGTMPGQASVGTPVATLTRREREIASLMARGLTNRQIATELVISEHTAATHVRKILKKLGLRSRAQVASWLSGQRLS